jgi:predicted Rossmann fold flavoprotein
MAAISAGRQSGGRLRIVVVDGAARLGAKILISGGGRCNVTNARVTAADFYGTNRSLIAKVLRALDVAGTVEFFEGLGVELKTEENGKLFPTSDRARSVLDALLAGATAAGVALVHPWRAAGLERRDGMFVVSSTGGEAYTSPAVILATGGRSVPKTGSDGGGYELARHLGHRVTSTYPALVPLLLPPQHWMCSLSGLSFEGEIRLHSGSGAIESRRAGPILLTHFGLSGPAVLDISREWIIARDEKRPATIQLSLLRGWTFESLDTWIVQGSRTSPRMTMENLLSQRLPARLAAALLHECGLSERATLGRLTREQRRSIAHHLTALDLPVSGSRGFDYAEVTAGGVPLTEIDPSTMQSRLVPGLYLCGEILDVDGRIGGFNFQWAWSSGQAAGKAAARMLQSGGR